MSIRLIGRLESPIFPLHVSRPSYPQTEPQNGVTHRTRRGLRRSTWPLSRKLFVMSPWQLRATSRGRGSARGPRHIAVDHCWSLRRERRAHTGIVGFGQLPAHRLRVRVLFRKFDGTASCGRHNCDDEKQAPTRVITQSSLDSTDRAREVGAS